MRSALLTVLVGCMLILVGCIDYQETITLNDDGSGTIAIRYAMDKEFLEQSEQYADSASENESDIPSEEEIREGIKSANTSVKLISYKESEDEKWKIWEMEFSFEQLSDFDRMGMELSGEESPSGSDQPVRKYEKQPDGTWLFSYDMSSAGFGSDGSENAEMPSDSAFAEAMKQMQESQQSMDEYEDESEYSDDTEMPDSAMSMDAMMEEFAAGMQQMMAGASSAKIKMTVNFPGRVTESNATKIEGNTAIWEAGLYNAPEEMTAKIKP